MKWFYFESDRGCGIREARSIVSAKKKIRHEVGESYTFVVREATKKDIAWVSGMGGYLPPLPPKSSPEN